MNEKQIKENIKHIYGLNLKHGGPKPIPGPSKTEFMLPWIPPTSIVLINTLRFFLGFRSDY